MVIPMATAHATMATLRFFPTLTSELFDAVASFIVNISLLLVRQYPRG
jgi:hypothetical protein